MSAHLVRIQILRMLLQCGGYELPESALQDQLGLVAPLLEDEISEALGWLKAKAYIDFTVEELSGEKRWSITASGKAKLK